MARGPKKHLKRLNAPKHWMLDKMGALRNRLKYALDAREAKIICQEKSVLVDGKRIDAKEINFKYVKVVALKMGKNKTPSLFTHDGRTVRFPDPLIKVDDTVKIDLKTGKIVEHLKYDIGKHVIAMRGNSTGRSGKVIHKDRHLGSFDIVTVKDAEDNTFTTRMSNIMVVGDDDKCFIELPTGNGVRRTILEEQDAREQRRNA